MIVVLIYSLICVCGAFRFPQYTSLTRLQSKIKMEIVDRASFLDSSFLLLPNDPVHDDLKKYSMILANVTDHLENPLSAKTIIDSNAMWLMQQDLPRYENIFLSFILKSCAD